MTAHPFESGLLCLMRQSLVTTIFYAKGMTPFFVIAKKMYTTFSLGHHLLMDI